MNSSNNRKNHNFQIAYFIAGACHTPDAAYAILCDLHEERDNSIKMFEASKLREKAQRIKAQRLIDSSDEVDQLEGQADIVEIDAMALTVQKNIDAAIVERTFIEECMVKLEPLRKFKDLSLPEAHEAAQQEEWLLELITRAENYMISQGSIPADHFGTMRMHPEYATRIIPAIATLESLINQSRSGDQKLGIQAATELVKITISKQFQLPDLNLLLGNNNESKLLLENS
jgi:hypothetical protein